MARKIAKEAVDFIKTAEGFRAEAYPDPASDYEQGKKIAKLKAQGKLTDEMKKDPKVQKFLTTPLEKLSKEPVTIGYGTTGPDIKMGMVWTEKQAQDRLILKIEEFAKGVDALVKVTLNDNQRSALISLAYNIGIHGLSTSTVLKKVNKKDHKDLEKAFVMWNKSNGIVVDGLTARRKRECALFLKEV